MFLFFVQKLKSIFFLFFNVFRRAFCCFKRRRRQSKDEPLSNVVVSEKHEMSKSEMEQWNDWEFKNRKPASVEEHIEFYRQQQAKLRQSQTVKEETRDGEAEEDLFNDMMPQITKQAKILIGKEDRQGGNQNALSLQATDAYLTNELENWDENPGWESENIDANELLREKKREERERRLLEQAQKRADRAEKSQRPNLGAKLVT